MKRIILFLCIVGIATSCSPDQDVTVVTNNYYYKKTSKDTVVDTIITFPVINDTIVEGFKP